MFRLDIPQAQYRQTWDVPYSSRLQTLTDGKFRIAFYYGLMPDSGTFRYRIYNMVNSLNSLGGDVSAAWFYYGELDRLSDVVEKTDVLVVCRGKYCDRLGHVLAVARNKGVRIVFDIDDLMFDPAYMHLTIKSADANYTRFSREEVWQYWYGDCARYAASLALCDDAVTTNEFLADRIHQYSGKDVTVLPNYLNEEQLVYSRQIYRQKKASGFARQGPLYLGYFSGSHSHNHDFQMLTDPLIALFGKYDNLKLRIVGLLDIDKRLAEWSNRIERYPLQDYITLQKLIGEVEINLVPLQVNAFTNSKSELKYFEAGIVGTLSMATPTSVYARAIRDGYNGFLVNSYEWYSKIDGLLSAMDLYPELAGNTFHDVEEKYAWNNLVDRIVKTYQG